MNFFKIVLVIVFFVSTYLFSQEITVIELHPILEEGEKNISDQETSIDEIIFLHFVRIFFEPNTPQDLYYKQNILLF